MQGIRRNSKYYISPAGSFGPNPDRTGGGQTKTGIRTVMRLPRQQIRDLQLRLYSGLDLSGTRELPDSDWRTSYDNNWKLLLLRGQLHYDGSPRYDALMDHGGCPPSTATYLGSDF
jgi:hypothetical protein